MGFQVSPGLEFGRRSEFGEIMSRYPDCNCKFVRSIGGRDPSHVRFEVLHTLICSMHKKAFFSLAEEIKCNFERLV